MKLLFLRKSKKLLQADIANYLGISKATYCKYETGALEINVTTAKKLADFYGVSLDYLCDRQFSVIGYVPEDRRTTLSEIADLNELNFEKVKAYLAAIKDLT